MTQAHKSGRALKRLGVTLVAAGFTTGYVVSFVDTWILQLGFKLFWGVVLVLSPTLTFAGFFLYWRGRQYAAQASAESVITDVKPHLLYLRPFRSDSTTIRGMAAWETEEEQLADVLRPFGELVAIGRPGESLPEPGAARIYASDEEWKDVVKRQMQATRLIVIRAAVGENVLWELTQAVRTVEPQKLLILAPEMKAEDYESFRTKENPILGVSLPERATSRRFGRVFGFRQVSGFISFAADWKPSFLALKGPYFRSGSFKGLATYALKPVFERFGLQWQRPPISASRVPLICFLIFGALVLAAIILLAIVA